MVLGLNSPVIVLVSKEHFFERSIPSTGTFSPTLTKIVSPIFTFSGVFWIIFSPSLTFALGEYVEGIAVMLFYQIGEMFQAVAVNNSRDNINALIDIKPEFANVKEGENIMKKTQKTPRREIEKAKRELTEIREQENE